MRWMQVPMIIWQNHFQLEELLARLRVTIRRLNTMKTSSEAEQSVYINGDLKIDYAARCVYMKDKELYLTPIEYKLLCLLAKNTGKVLTHTYITKEIWGNTWSNGVASLRVFMATLRKKIEKDPSPPNISKHILVWVIVCLSCKWLIKHPIL